MNSGATINMSLQQWDQTKKKIRDLEVELAATQSELQEARLGDPSSDLRAYRDAFAHAMRIARFGIGNLNPLTVRGWPYESLFVLADMLDSLPGLSSSDGDATSANELRIFARECKEWEDARAAGIEQEKLSAENAARGPMNPPEVA